MSDLKICPYGEKCYRRNPIHFKEFSHPHLDRIYKQGLDATTKEYKIPNELVKNAEIISQQLKLMETLFPKDPSAKRQENPQGRDKELPKYEKKRDTSPKPSTSTGHDINSNLAKKQKITRDIRDYVPVVVQKGMMAKKLESAAPYNFFLTAITDSKPTHTEPLSITFQEILDESLGVIESSVQINFMVDIGWLLGHYYFAGILDTPLLVLYGDDTPELQNISKHKPKVTAVKVKMSTPFSTSHTKMMLLGYKDGSMRVVVSTANLYEDDWHNRTQGLWISPRLTPLPESADTTAGESPTNFRQDLMLYLVEYKCAELQPWIARIRKTDFSAINVFFIGSVPGGHREGPRGHPWGHARVSSILQKHCAPVDDSIPIVCQSSSIGSLGVNVQAWIQNDFINSLRRDCTPLGIRKFPAFKMIYPSYSNVNNSHDGLLGGGCLPYSKNTNDKQPWLKPYLHQWTSKLRYRSQAMPHIKSYTRYNLDDKSIYWFLLTSANLSKAAWGSFNKNANIQACLRIANYEVGVLFLPRFVIGEDTFPLGSPRDGIPPFPLPYDVPLSPYSIDDKPFLMDYLHM
ncbi:tyrosyl-DNA phosphodiesterase glaikit [Haematobia irritans]|uniref:tyrosyl-DNA phosphodiesterase glaikit n=1 Tax=Haematobia irritans TaxID=7368 RepID=UPI003F4F4CB3